MGRQDIALKVLWIINEKLSIGNCKLTLDYIDVDLLSKDIGFEARDLLMLFNSVEQVFNIKITEELFEKYDFRTIQNIVGIVEGAWESV